MSRDGSGAGSPGAAGAHGAVSAGHPLAADAALGVLRQGGNAVDALVAGSAVQCVVEMPWCGVGGDAFVAVRWGPGDVAVLNGSGAAPAGVEAALAAAGAGAVPRFGPLSVAVPGTVGAWGRLAERFGSWPLARALAPAVALADDGFPLDARLAAALAGIAGAHPGLHAALTAGTGRRAGERFRQPDLAATLAGIGADGPAHLYAGPVARAVAAHVRGGGGALTEDDLAAHDAAWAAPLTVRYRGTDVHTQGPVSMGAVLLAQLAVLDALDVAGLAPGSPELLDLQVRAKLAAFAGVLPGLGDPAEGGIDAAGLVDPARWAAEAARIAAGDPLPGGVPGAGAALAPTGADTTSLAVTDAAGRTAVLVHSLFNEFGARDVVPGTGLVLNDRLANLAPGPGRNALRGGRRPVHTLHTWVAERPDGTVLAGATPGGRGQVQTNLQVLGHLVDRGDDPQAAVDRPRWVSGTPRRSPPDDTLYLEADLPPATATALAARGHAVEVRPAAADDHFGCATVVAVAPAGEATAGGPGRRHLAGADRRRGAAARAW